MADQQWPPARGIPGQRRYKKASKLEWGETPFDDLDRGELLRLVQAYHAAALSARSVLHMSRYGQEDSPYWGTEGTGGRALARLEYLIFRAGDGKGNEGSERIYRRFFRSAHALLFPGLGIDEQWGIDDVDGTMTAPYEPGATSPFKPHRPMRPIKWRDLLPTSTTPNPAPEERNR